MRIDYFLNGSPVNPVKREEIYLEINHDQESVINQPRPHVGINNLRFAREDVAAIMTLLSQPPGITEGISFDIRITERNVAEVINMYIDLMEDFQKSNEGIQVKVKMLQSLDWLDDKADAFTFESLYNEQGVHPFVIDGVTYPSYQRFLDAKCIYIPYVISTVPNWHDAFLAILGITYIGTQLYQVSKSIAQWAVPLEGFGIVFGIAQLVAEIAFATLLIITLISLITQLINCLVQPIKYHGGMLLSDMLKLTAVKLGLTAESSIWDVYPYNQIAYLPEKYSPVELSTSLLSIMGFSVDGFGDKGYTSPATAPSSSHDSQTQNIQHGYYNGTGGDFLRLIKSICNGKIIIPDQTNSLVLERRDYYPSGTPYQLPDLRQDWNGYNTDELTANIIIKFLSDLNERNCIDHISPGGVPFFPGTILQATHQQATTLNPLMVCLKGLREITIPAARGVAKDKLTFVEKAVSDLELVWNGIIVLADIGIFAINILIAAANVVISVVNVFIAIWNTIIDVLHAITDVINVIIDAINTVPGIDVDNIEIFDNGAGKLHYLGFIDPVSFVSLSHYDFSNRLNALLLENDIVSTPKLILVNTARSEFIASRIAYVHADNARIVHAGNLWDKFYSIDAFTGPDDNRQTKISPALNNPGEKNRCSLSLSDFKNLVSNPKFFDNYGEEVISDSIQWHIEQNGAADFNFRKKGWLADPQNPNASLRSQEIYNNLVLKISLPNGQ